MKVMMLSSMYLRPDKKIHANFIHRQAIELSKLGVEIIVICPIAIFRGPSSFFVDLINANKQTNTINIDNISVTYLPYWNIPLWFSASMDIASHYRSLSNYLRKYRYDFNFDLIHAHRLFPTGYVAMLIARQLDVPFVVTARGSDVHTNPHKNSGIAHHTQAVIKECDQILSVSESLASDINNLAKPIEPTKVIYNGVDIDIFRPTLNQQSIRKRLNLPKNGVGLCTICRLVKEKGLIELLKAFKKVTEQYPYVWLAIVGNGPLRNEMESFVKKQHIESIVYFAGSRPHNEIPDWMNASDIFTLSSYNEGMPNVLLEAMACARPVVATNVGGIPEAAVNNISALLVPKGQVEPLVKALRKLVQSPELRNQMGTAGYDIVRRKFKWDTNSKALAEIYYKLINSTGHKSSISHTSQSNYVSNV